MNNAYTLDSCLFFFCPKWAPVIFWAHRSYDSVYSYCNILGYRPGISRWALRCRPSGKAGKNKHSPWFVNGEQLAKDDLEKIVITSCLFAQTRPIILPFRSTIFLHAPGPVVTMRNLNFTKDSRGSECIVGQYESTQRDT